MDLKPRKSSKIATTIKLITEDIALWASIAFIGLLLAYSSSNEQPSLQELKKDLSLTLKAEWVSSLIEIRKNFFNLHIHEIDLHINQTHYMKLKALRDMALTEKAIRDELKQDWFPAKIIDSKGFIQKAKVRLKGDMIDHLDHDYKWSLRVRMGKKNSLFGMRQFSIHHPKTKMYLSNVLVSQLFEKLKGLSPKTFFVKVKINGKNIGLMNIEEVPGKDLLERQGRRNGVIVRFNEKFLMEEWILDKQLYERKATPYPKDYYAIFNKIQNTRIDPVNKKKVFADPEMTQQYLNAVSLLRAYLSGKLPAFSVFDREKLLDFLAYTQITPISDYYHSLDWKNMRFYYNPINHKLEPFFLDTNCRLSTVNSHHFFNFIKMDQKDFDTDKWHYVSLLWYKTIVEDRKFLSDLLERIRLVIGRIKKENCCNDVFEKMYTYNKLLEIEYGETFEKFNENLFMNYLDFISKELQRQPPSYQEVAIKETTTEPSKTTQDLKKDSFSKMQNLIHVYNLKEVNPTLELVNPTNFPVTIEQIYSLNKKGDIVNHLAKDKLPFSLAPHKNTVLGSTPKSYFLGYKPLKKKSHRIKIIFKLHGIEKEYTQIATTLYSRPAKTTILPQNTIQHLLSQHPYIIRNGRKIRIKRGQWLVKENIIIPQGYQLEIFEGSRLQFKKNKGIISYSPVHLKGSKTNPVVLTGEENKPFNGLVVLNAPTASTIENVRFSWLNSFHEPLWNFTASILFYSSEVKINNLEIHNNFSEDAINIVQSKFEMNRVKVRNVVSDAFDSDFSVGKISNCQFEDIGTAGGGDALDFSGSNVEINHCQFINVKDKALSVGENSSISAHSIKIESSSVGLAVKDGSTLKAQNVQLQDITSYGIMAYNKKNTYGNGDINAKDVSFSNVSTLYKVQVGSSASINGEPISPEKMDVENLYNTKMKKGFMRAN